MSRGGRIGPHDPIVLSSGSVLLRGHVWVECECGWIGPSRTTETLALVTHAQHVTRATRGDA